MAIVSARITIERGAAQRPARGLAALALVLSFPALYLTAAARPNQPWQDVVSLSPTVIANVESDLRAHPEDLSLRLELLFYYSENGQNQEFTHHLLWFIQHHPDVSTLFVAQGNFHKKLTLSDEARTQIQQAWEQAVTAHADSPAVLVNAANFLQTTNPQRAVELLKQSKTLDPQEPGYYRFIAIIYAAAEAEPIHPGSKINDIQMSIQAATDLRAALAASHDPALLSETGEVLVEMSPSPTGDPQVTRGLELIQRAITLDPGNFRWTEALKSAQAEPAKRASVQALIQAHPPLQPGTVHIDAKIAEASLIGKTDPVYPPLALQSRIQGALEFTVIVGADGKVQKMSLVRGHPLLVQAAKDSILTHVYYPVLVDGKAVPFETQVVVSFQMSPSVDTPLVK